MHRASRTCIAALVAGVAAQFGCGGCPEVGCSSGIEVHYTSADVGGSSKVAVEACVAGDCRSSRNELVPGDHVVTLGVDDLDDRDSVDVSVTIRDAAGRVLVQARGRVPVVEFRPNGPNCPPPCHVARVRVDGTRLVAVA